MNLELNKEKFLKLDCAGIVLKHKDYMIDSMKIIFHGGSVHVPVSIVDQALSEATPKQKEILEDVFEIDVLEDNAWYFVGCKTALIFNKDSELSYGWGGFNTYFKCTKNDCALNDCTQGHANPKSCGSAFRKATLEELLNHFSEKEAPNCVKGGEAVMHEATHTVTAPNPKSFPRKMIVSDDEDFFENYEVEVHSYNPDLEFPFLTEQDYCGSINGYKFAKEVPEEESVKEMTVSEIQEKLGFKIKIVE